MLAVLLLSLTPIALPSQDQQTDPKYWKCGTELTTEEAEHLRLRWEQLRLRMPQVDTSVLYCIPCAMHIVRQDSGTGGIPLDRLDQAIIDANTIWAPANMQFYILSIDYIDSDDLYFNINTDFEIDILRTFNRVDNAINMYFTENLSNEDGSLCGKSSFTGTIPQGIAFANGCVGLPENPSTFPHEIGHYFDLFHTHETAFGEELVDGSNCASEGDLLCDTPADPKLGDHNVTPHPDCIYTGTATDDNDDPYNPDVSQIMSYAPKLCRNTISPQGYGRALIALLGFRPLLLVRGCWPTANAGPDQTVECTSPVGTDVQMDGSGSSDPDGDPLTYSWEAGGGVTFNDPSIVNPVGNFPLGLNTVRLVVSDGMFNDTDYVDIRIVDTTPPVITCPDDITIECMGHCGTLENDPQLDTFWADVSATDICDLSPSIIDEIADGQCLPKDTTEITFTATDPSGNSSSCTADVIVEDTTPPEITVEISRDVLWPPNHKMGTIFATVTVTDVCCPNPTYWLESITSNEPPNDKGDGATEADWNIINNDEFELRSERKGGGNGRIYSIMHIAEDCDGNRDTSIVYVEVPHDKSGVAISSSGFMPDGKSLITEKEKFAIIIPSLRGKLNATELDPKRVYIGNIRGVVRPMETKIIDIDGDGRDDLGLYYSTPAVMGLLRMSNEISGDPFDRKTTEPVGIHYTTPKGKNYLVTNIFDLGSAVQMQNIVPRNSATSEEAIVHETPNTTQITSIFPNPFQQSTTVGIHMENAAHVKLRVYDTRGVLVRTLTDHSLPSGPYHAVWDGKSEHGRRVATGVYFIRFTASSLDVTRKIVLLR
jgi:hypothetical protein